MKAISSVQSLLRQDLQEMAEYAPPGRTVQTLAAELGVPVEQIIKLDANENPYGSSPRAYEALGNYRRYHIYPDADQRALRDALGHQLGIDPAQILAGNGSDELIDLIHKLAINPGDRVINCPPTFSVYPLVAKLYRANVIEVCRRADFALDVEAIERGVRSGDLGSAKMLTICSPNNPDGGVTTPETIERLLQLPLLLVLDEAYVDFAGQSLVQWTDRYPNLIVLRTFSKWLGLAGLRVGYGVFPPALAREIWKIKPPYNLNAAAQVAALASLEDLAYMEECKKRILGERDRLYRELQSIPYLHPYPSQANFILVRVLDRPASRIKGALENQGILVRQFGEPELAEHLRISVGRPEQTDALLSALHELEGSEKGEVGS